MKIDNATINSVKTKIKKRKKEQAGLSDDEKLYNRIVNYVKNTENEWQNQDYIDSVKSDIKYLRTKLKLQQRKNKDNEEKTASINGLLDSLSTATGILDEAGKRYSGYKNAEEYNTAKTENGYSTKWNGKFGSYTEAKDYLNSNEYTTQRSSGAVSDEEDSWLKNYIYSLATSNELLEEVNRKQGIINGPDLEKRAEEAKKFDPLSNNTNALPDFESAYNNSAESLNEYAKGLGYASYEDYKADIPNIQNEIEVLKTAAAKRKAKEEFEDEWAESITSAEDFEEASKYVSTNLDGKWAEMTSQYSMGYNDLTYEYINNVDGMREKIRTAATAYRGSGEKFFDDKNLDYMTDEEIKAYNYYYSKYGKDKANKYLEDLNDTYLDERANTKIYEKMSDFASQNGWAGLGASALSVATSLGSGIEYAGNVLSGEGDKRSKLSTATSGLRTGTKENWSDSKHAQVWDFLYDTGMSGADSLAAAGLSFALPGAGEAILGASAAASKANELLDRGVTGYKVVTGAVTAGVLEAVFEHITIGNLGPFKTAKNAWGFTKEGLKQAAKDISKSVIVNGSEEFFTEVANIVADELWQGELSQYASAVEEYYAQGMSAEEAKAKATSDTVEQIGMAGLSGMLMGLGFGSLGSVSSMATNSRQNARSGRYILANSSLDSFKAVAATSSNASTVKAAEKLTSSSKASAIGEVFNTYKIEVYESAKEQLVTELKKNGAGKSVFTKAEVLANEIIDNAIKSQNGELDTMADVLARSDSISGDTYTAFVDQGKFGGKEVLALNKAVTAKPSARATGVNSVGGESVVGSEQSDIVANEQQAEALATISDDNLQSAVDYYNSNGGNIPLNILGTNTGSSVYKGLEAAGLINQDGTVNATALVNEHNRRNGRQNSALQGNGQTVIIKNNKTNPDRSEKDGSTDTDILEGRKVSASGRGKNRIRTHGANTEIIRGELEGLPKGEGNNDISLAAGETAWLSSPDFGPAQKVGGGLGESFLRNIRRVKSNGFDSIGRILSPELQEKISDTVFMEEDGTVFSFFHWTPNKFDEFKYGDGAFHCGTLQSALAIKNRSEKKVDGYIKEMYVISKNPFILRDRGRFGAYVVASQLEEFGIIEHNDLLKISKMDGFFSDRYDAKANVYVRGILESLGYDSYLYQNLNEDGGSWSVGVFNADQIITIAENGVLKENCGVTEADSVDGSVSSFADSEDVNADADVNADNYAKEDKYWEAENENKKNVSKGLFDKIKNLFSNKNADSLTSIGEIVKQIEKDFGVPISTGRFKQKAYGIYKNRAEAIRTKVSNALPTIAHEIGHHLDKRYKLSELSSIGEAVDVLKNSRPDFFKSYSVETRPHEAVAEFIRIYLTDRTLAKNNYPKFFVDFENALSSTKNTENNGSKDLENLKAIGDMINRYYTSEKAERARAAVISRAEAKRINRMNKTIKDYFMEFKAAMLDDGAVLKEVSESAHNLFDYAKKGVVRAYNTLTGYYMVGFDGKPVKLLDKNGKPVKDENGNDTYVPAFTHLFKDIKTETELDDFRMYLIYKHGLEFLANGKRVFADDTINNKEYMSEQITSLEEKYPHFKESADNIYGWQRTFMNEYGVKSGLMSRETAEALWQKYPCYVPFNRNVENTVKLGSKGFANRRAAIKKAKGSGLEIFDPIENIAVKVEEFMNAADRNAVMQEIADTVDTKDGFGYVLEKVPGQQKAVSVSADKTKDTIRDILSNNLKSAEANSIYDELDNAIGNLITEFQISPNQATNIVWVCRNGKKTYYQVHDVNMLKALTGLNKSQFGVITRIAGKITRLFKALTTGGNAVWSLTSNSVRDFSSAYKYSVEKNPIKFTLDYVKAIGNVISQVGDKDGERTSEYLKLYRTLGGGYNSSLVNVGQLKTTVADIVKLDKTMPQKVADKLNILHKIETFSDAVETAPRLAEFKRVLEKTGDTKAAMRAAEEITVNFNRSGSVAKKIDQYIPYFNASIQGTSKFIDNLLHNSTFRTKTIVSGILKVGLLFAWNMIAMGDGDNDEYEKLSAYKKNNFYNIYKGDGKFISIPKAKDTAYFDSIVERIFEMAFKDDVEWAQEVQDFAAYTWLIFGPPLADDVIIGSTVIDLVSNTDFKGSPIVPKAYEELNAEYQYNENTTWIAYGIGQLFGWSPMKIDHIIDSNLGYLGLFNKSLGKMSGENDWTLGVGTKTVTDNTYSTDILNHFYDNADKASKTAKSIPDNGEAVAKNKQYTAAKSIISALNAYGKEDETSTREYRIMARDYADDFEKNTVGNTDERLIALYERTENADIFADKSFNRDYTIDKVKYTMDSDAYLDYVDEYYSKVGELYDEILSLGSSDEMTVLMLTQAKQEVEDLLNDKYKTGSEKQGTDSSTNWKSNVVEAMEDNIDRKWKQKEVSTSEKNKYKKYLNYLD